MTFTDLTRSEDYNLELKLIDKPSKTFKSGEDMATYAVNNRMNLNDDRTLVEWFEKRHKDWLKAKKKK